MRTYHELFKRSVGGVPEMLMTQGCSLTPISFNCRTTRKCLHGSKLTLGGTLSDCPGGHNTCAVQVRVPHVLCLYASHDVCSSALIDSGSAGPSSSDCHLGRFI